MAPSVQSKIDSHKKSIQNVYNILPVSKLIIEAASFDIQKINNPEISGEDYQKGEQLGFWNVREYVLFRDGHKCQGKKNCTNKILNVHHIESRKTGGDSPGNLITLCEKCHSDYHKGIFEFNVTRKKSYKDAAFMGIMRWRLYNDLKETYKNVSLTYGYITKNTRIKNGFNKSHRVDAFCITKNIFAERLQNYFQIKQVRKKKRTLHEATARKGRKKANVTSKRNKKNTKQIVKKDKTWCLWDKIKVGKQLAYITGFSGKMVYLQNIYGEYIQLSRKYKQVNTDNIKLIERNNNWICQEAR